MARRYVISFVALLISVSVMGVYYWQGHASSEIVQEAPDSSEQSQRDGDAAESPKRIERDIAVINHEQRQVIPPAQNANVNPSGPLSSTEALKNAKALLVEARANGEMTPTIMEKVVALNRQMEPNDRLESIRALRELIHSGDVELTSLGFDP